MKKILNRIMNGVLSLLTTVLLMASPVAAVVYAAEPADAARAFSLSAPAAVTAAHPAPDQPAWLDDLYDDLLGAPADSPPPTDKPEEDNRHGAIPR